MNLGFGRGDSDEKVSENYRRFCAAAGFDPESLVCGVQVHKTDIRRVGLEHRGQGIWRENSCQSADGLCTNVPGVTLVVYAADCVPVYFVDPVRRAIGLAHAGWRGAAAGMPQVMVRRMAEEFGSRRRTCWPRWAPPSAGSALRWTNRWPRCFWPWQVPNTLCPDR